MSISHLSLFKRSNGVWYILCPRDGRTRWESTGATVKNEASWKLSEFRKLCQTKPKSTSMSQIWNEFQTFGKADYSQSTLELVDTGIAHLKGIFGDCIFSSITPEHVDRDRAWRLLSVNELGKRVSPVTINAELRALRSVFNTALQWKMLEFNPFSKFRLLLGSALRIAKSGSVIETIVKLIVL